jgi:hypothetical protein
MVYVAWELPGDAPTKATARWPTRHCRALVGFDQSVDFLPVRKGTFSRIRASFRSAGPLPSRISRASVDSILPSSAPEVRIEGDFTRPGRVLRMCGCIVFPSQRDGAAAYLGDMLFEGVIGANDVFFCGMRNAKRLAEVAKMLLIR